MSLEFSHGPEAEQAKPETTKRGSMLDQLEAWWEGGAERVQYVKDHLLETADDLSDAIGVIAASGDAEVLKVVLDNVEVSEMSARDLARLNELAHEHAPKVDDTLTVQTCRAQILEDQRYVFRQLNKSPQLQEANRLIANLNFDEDLPPPAYLEGMPESFLANVHEEYYSEGSANQLWLQSFPDSPLVDEEEVSIYVETQLEQIRATGDLYRCKTDPLSMYGVFANPNCKPRYVCGLVHAMFNHVLDNPNDPRDQEKIRKLDELVSYHGGKGAVNDFESFKYDFNNPEDDTEARA